MLHLMLWWRWVLLQCLLSLGAGAFLPSKCCSFAAAASAAIAAAAADPSAVAHQQQQSYQQQAVCFKEFGMYPPTLPFVCRQLVVLLLRTSLGAVKRNAADKEGQRAADGEIFVFSGFGSSSCCFIVLRYRSFKAPLFVVPIAVAAPTGRAAST